MRLGLLGATSSSSNLGDLANYGVLGIFAMLLLIFAQRQVKREQDRADRLEARMEEKDRATIEKVIPALESATVAVQAAAVLLKEIDRERELEAARRQAGTR